MQFNSFIFILLFLPITVLLYFLGNKINDKVGKIILVIVGLFFYAYSSWKALLIFISSILINYVFALLIQNKLKWRKWFVSIPVAINIGLLFYFKYFGFFLESLSTIGIGQGITTATILPIGISFFTFQQIAYLVSTYRKELKVDFLDYLVFITFFPKILMGPLMEPVDFIKQINDTSLKKFNADNLTYGLKIFSLGLFKKMLIADIFAKAVSWAYTNIAAATAVDWILVMLFYTFEIYFDFSGYSDMATGSSIMLNITLPINFDSPYKALSVRDFWKRWHISLTRFLTKYLYIPLGGSRKGKILTYVNTIIVFFASGLWHGANWTFILWGLIYGLLMVFDRIFEKKEEKVFKPLRWIITFIIINVLWLLFRSDSVSQWITILKQIVLFQNKTISAGLLEPFALTEFNVLTLMFQLTKYVSNINGLWMILYLVVSLLICLIPENNYRSLKKISGFTMFISAVLFVWAFLYLSSESVFLYFNF